MIYRLQDPSAAEPLFRGWDETLIWSCLQDVMGDVYADSPEHPSSAMAMIADFIFFAGVPNESLVHCKPDTCTRDFILMVPQDDRWSRMIADCYGERAKRVTRYAIKKESDIFDRQKLRRITESLPSGYQLKAIDEAIYAAARTTDWCVDWVSAYPDYNAYRRLGFGFVLKKDGEIVAGASSYTRYRDGIEIQIDTRQDCRHQGFATICGARLILEALDRGLYPSWDAQNLWSVGLAEKLGYHFDHKYPAFEIYGY